MRVSQAAQQFLRGQHEGAGARDWEMAHMLFFLICQRLASLLEDAGHGCGYRDKCIGIQLDGRHLIGLAASPGCCSMVAVKRQL